MNSSCGWMPVTALLSVTSALAVAAPMDYAKDVQPILAARCYECHGPEKHKGGFRADSKAHANGAIDSGERPVVPGDVAKSLLIKLVRSTDHDEMMPPKGARLTPAQVDVLTRWIAEGARWPDAAAGVASAKSSHWAFVKPVKVAPPAVKAAAWVRNPIDAFVLAVQEKQGLNPSPQADRYALIRRATLDLTGLPPTPAEVTGFVGDPSPDAYERLIDRLLASPAYGERWARVWMDLARYADSAGLGSDPLRHTAWPYRDWVINAFNRNLPYDEFTIEQIAGDLLPDATRDQVVATGFHRNTMTNTEGGTDDEEWRVAAVKDRTNVTAQAWMGLTMGCTECHTHKYDPITQREYYEFFAFFNQTEDDDQPNDAPTIPVPTAAQERRRGEIEQQMAGLKAEIGGLTALAPKSVTPHFAPQRARLARLSAALTEMKPPLAAVMRERPAAKRRATHVLVKGNWMSRGDAVAPGVPAAPHPLPAGASPDRLGLARWLVDPENPLTARVAVNRLWASLFGAGIVLTQEDFGTMGQPPTHPELLDWLAVTFRADLKWDVKALVKLVMTSATYRQTSRLTPELLERDPTNRSLAARPPRLRLEAEAVRDQALALGGLLSPKMFGPSVYPPQPPNLWQAAFNGERNYPTSAGEDKYRRGLYTFWRRTTPYPSMAAFDAPSREQCTVRRIHTSTPIQAFVTLNDPVYVEAAQALARRVVKEGGATEQERAKWALELCLGRPASAEQVKHLAALHGSEVEHYREDKAAATAMATEPLGPLPDGADAAEMAAWTVVSNVLLNLDGVLTKS